MKSVDINALGQAIDSSWGKSSTHNTSIYSIKFSFGAGYSIIAKLTIRINVGNRASIIQVRNQYEDETSRVINAALKKVKEEYKELTGKTVTFNKVTEDNDIEMLGSLSSPRRDALFKKTIVFEYL